MIVLACLILSEDYVYESAFHFEVVMQLALQKWMKWMKTLVSLYSLLRPPKYVASHMREATI